MIKLRINHIAVTALALIALVMSGCSSNKGAVSSTGKDSGKVVAQGGAPGMLREVISAQLPWEKLRMPLTVNLESPTSIGLSGTASMERGKSINISMRVLGMEVAVLYLTPDSVTVLDKWNKRYVSEGLKKFLGDFPVNMYNVQDVLLGRAFILGQEALTSMDLQQMDFETNGTDRWACQPKNAPANSQYAFVFMNNILESMVAGIVGKEPVKFRYSEPELTRFGPMAGQISFSASAKKKPIIGSLTWNFDKCKWNSEVDIRPVSIPRGYSKIEASDILRGITKL